MMLLWCGFIGLFVLRLVKRHGWEYVPLVFLLFGAWAYFGAVSDGMLLTAVSAVHLVTRRDMVADG